MKHSLKLEAQRCLGRDRRGFTLPEVMISTALALVITSQVVMAVISSQRMLEVTFADMELSLQSRALREKLLYNVNEDGGLMNVSQSELLLVNGNNNKGDGISFKPKKGKKNRIVLGSNKKLDADLNRKEKWLGGGTMLFQGTNVFGLYMTNGTIEVNLDVVIPISNRRYEQRNIVKAQIMNE
jgi:prepilin-type N-terminal cleavage/methylation domain-containing protein